MKTELRCSQEEHFDQKFPHKLWDDDKGCYTKKNCKGPGVMKELPYDDMTWEELAGKIDYEGGLAEFFTGYQSPDGSNDPKLNKLAAALADAYNELHEYMIEKGGVL